SLPFGRAYAAVDAGGVHGVAAWLPPGAYPPSVARQLRQLPGLVRIASLAPRRLRFLFASLGELVRVHPKEEHWYLALLAVDPFRQGQGVGRKLIAPALAQADADGLSCYLETTKVSNVAWYRGAGFDVVDELHIRDTGGVGQHKLGPGAARGRTEVADLGVQRPAVVERPRPLLVPEERLADVVEHHLFAVGEVVHRRIEALALARPGAEQERQGP